MKKSNGKICLAALFLMVTAFFFVANFSSIYGMLKTEVKAALYKEHRGTFMSPEEMEAAYTSDFYGRLGFVDINGAIHRVLGQKLVNGTIKGAHGKLFLDSDRDYIFDETLEQDRITRAVSILKEAQSAGALTLYVQHPHKFIKGQDALPYGMKTEYSNQYDFWCEQIEESDISVLDLRYSIKNELDFYDTDHHWTVESSFHAAANIAEALSTLEPEGNYSREWIDIEDYMIKTYPNAFLGSEGVKTGKYYVGKDDFSILIPTFETDFSYQHYVEHELRLEKSGPFMEAFIDETILEDEGYYNKYNACLHGGYVENIIINRKNTEGKKLLLVADSFARPMVMYLSLGFSETRYIDPQEGRYNDSYIEYIERYQPDVVIMMYTGDFQLL